MLSRSTTVLHNPPTPAVAGERVREAILAVFFSGAESDVWHFPVQKATLGSRRARQEVPLGLHWQGDVVFRKRPQASLEAWQAEPRATVKKLVFSPVQKASLFFLRFRKRR